MPPKAGRKKGKRGGDDSDDDPLADQLAHLNNLKIKSEPAQDDAPVTSKTSDKKDKKEKKKDKGKQGKGGRGDSDDDVDPLAALRKANQESDDEEEVIVKKEVPKSDKAPPASKSNDKKDKKKDKRKGGRGDSDDDVDPMLALRKANQESDDEEEVIVKKEVPKNDKAPPASKSNDKKDKKKDKRKGGRGDSDDDVDPMLALKKANQESVDEEEVIVKKEVSKKDSKKQESKKKIVEESDDDEEEEDEDEEEQEKPVAAVVSKVIDEVAIDKNVNKNNKKQKGRYAKKEAAEPVVVAPVSRVIVENRSLVESKKVPEISAAPVVVERVSAAESTEPAVPQPAAKKSKLQLKLENAKKEKKEADDAERERVAAVEAAAAVQAALEAKAKKAARLVEEAAKAARDAEIAALKGDDDEIDDDEDDDEEEEEAEVKKASVKPEMTDKEKQEYEARMSATMFGDEVFSEYSRPQAAAKQEEEEEEGAETGTKGKRGKDKVSNKMKRKMLKESEAKEREEEYNKVLMKRSIEGGQFACSQSIIDPNDPIWQNMLDIIIPNFSISAHSKELFLNAELNIVHGRRYGLVGPNGAGKSTLLKMIAAGELKIPPRIDVLYVEQEVLADDTPAVDAVLKADKERWSLVQEEKELLAHLEKHTGDKSMEKENEKKDQRLGEIYEQLQNMNASSSESKARRILFGLGFNAEMQIRPTKYFSGGWRMRISLAKSLFIEPNFLMLDEPTNHLDLNAVIWLDDYLQRWKKTLLIVSHDQDFLNSVCQEIMHLDDKKVNVYKGNYDNFKEQEAVKQKQQQKLWEKQERKLRELKSKGVSKENAEKAQLKAKAREPGARAKKAEAAAASSGGLESGESKVELVKRPRDYAVTFSFPEVSIISPPIMEVRDVNFRYGPTLPWLFKGVNFGLDMSSRVCIVGPNGSGKSTIIKIITGELNPPEGEVRRNPRLRVGIYNQHFVDRLPMDEDPVSYLRRLFNEETYQSCRNHLGKYGLEGHAHCIPIRDLSGGQKARVVFVELSLMAPHLLFLDEPTNNLDIESIDALCDALKLFNGGVVMVSHDARLIETTDCVLWVVEDQNVWPWETGFKGYRQHLLRKLEDQLAAIMPGCGERPGEELEK